MDCRREFCKNCNLKTDLIEQQREGTYVCGSCGAVLEQFLDNRTEWRTFSNNDKSENKDSSRAGQVANEFLSDAAGLATVMSGGTEKSKELSRQHQKTTLTASDRQLIRAVKEINALGERMNLKSKVTELGKLLYKAAMSSSKGCSMKGMVTASVYLACRKNNMPWSISEMETLGEAKRKEIFKCLKIIQTAKKIKIKSNNSKDFMVRYCNILKLDPKVREHAEKISTTATEKTICGGRSPLSVAAASILIATLLSDAPKTLKEIASVVDVTVSTIQMAARKLYEQRKEINFPEYIAKGKTIESIPKI